MSLTRRRLIATASAALLAPHIARAATVTDDAGRTVSVSRPVRRVFPAGPPAAILLYTLAPDLLLGWPHANRPEECAYMLPDICTRPEVGRLTGRGNTAGLDAVIALKPDLIFDVGSIRAPYVALAQRVQQQTGIPYALLNGGVLSLSTSYEKLGTLVGRMNDGLDFGDYCNMTLGAITNRIAFVTRDKRPRVYYARGRRGLVTGLGGASQLETIELLARNVAGETQGGLIDVTLDQIGTWDPDLVIATDPAFVAGVKSAAGWTSLRAVRGGRVHLAPRMPFGWIDAPPSGNRLIGLWWLAQLFYPDLFMDDIRELTRDFYTKFYHVTPTDLRIDYVLAGKN